MAANDFTHVGIRRETQRKISILSSVFGEKIYEVVGTWVDREWKSAREAGLVTDAMLEPVGERETA